MRGGARHTRCYDAPMEDGDGRSVAQAWRPQRFGHQRAGAIDDPIIEPLWGGDRTLVVVSAPGERPQFIDEDGAPLDDPLLEPIVADLSTSLRADSVVLDGYLTRQPNVDRSAGRDDGPGHPDPRQMLGTAVPRRRAGTQGGQGHRPDGERPGHRPATCR